MKPTDATYPPEASKPASFSHRIPLAVSGLTPQIVTETLYALAADEHAPYVPTEVHLITSAEGARRAELSLLSDDLGWFHKLCTDYHLPGVHFDRSHIHVMRDAHGQPMNDIRSPQDNRAAADFITAQVRAFTADPDCSLHASIAGLSDVAMGVRVSFAGGPSKTHGNDKNEIDVAFLYRNTLHIIECKTSNLAQLGHGEDNKATEALYKIESLLKLGGLRTRGMVVDYRGELAKSEANQKRAAKAGIAIVSGAQLKDLKGVISRQWLTARKSPLSQTVAS